MKPSVALLVLTTVLLSACASGPGGPVPNNASFNGVTKLDPAEGTAELSVSALRDDQVLTSGVLNSPVATVDPITTNLTAQQTYSARAEVCGNIISKGEAITGVLTLDATGSMSSNDPLQLRAEAAKNFVERMNAQDKAAIASFDTLTAPTPPYTDLTIWQEFSNDKALLNEAVDEATFARGSTNVWDAASDSVALLGTATGTNKVLILLTDGEDNRSSKVPQDVIGEALASSASVFTIGLGKAINDRELLEVAGATGGTFNQVEQAADLIGLYDSVFNATRASGCIQLDFDPTPEPGTVLTGTLAFTVNDARLETPYTVPFPDN